MNSTSFDVQSSILYGTDERAGIIYLGTHVGCGVERISNFPTLGSRDCLLDELVVDSFLDIDTRTGDANLSLEVYRWLVCCSVELFTFSEPCYNSTVRKENVML